MVRETVLLGEVHQLLGKPQDLGMIAPETAEQKPHIHGVDATADMPDPFCPRHRFLRGCPGATRLALHPEYLCQFAVRADLCIVISVERGVVGVASSVIDLETGFDMFAGRGEVSDF